MGFTWKTLFLGTGRPAGLPVKVNAKKERAARALEQQVRLEQAFRSIERQRKVH